MRRQDWRPDERAMRGGPHKRRCSRLCGRGCTEEEYRTALLGAREVVLRLGPGWTWRVWENLGWHFTVTSPCRRLSVERCAGQPFYTATLGAAAGEEPSWIDDGRTPEIALRKAVARAIRDRKKLEKLTAGLEDFAKIPERSAR